MLVSSAQREALLDEFERSGVSAMAFCKRHALVYPTFAAWVQKRHQRPAPGAPAFAEVVVESRGNTAPTSDGSRLRPANPPRENQMALRAMLTYHPTLCNGESRTAAQTTL
jgi:hypothetical protein